MPSFTYSDAILIFEITYVSVVAMAITLLVVRPLVGISFSRWITPVGALPTSNRLLMRALVLLPFAISIVWLHSFWVLIGALYNNDPGPNIALYGALYLIPALLVVALSIRVAIGPLIWFFASCVDSVFRQIVRVPLVVLLRRSLLQTTLFLLLTPARRISLVGVSLAGILLGLAVRHTIMPWALVTETLYLAKESGALSRYFLLTIAEISTLFVLFFLIIFLVIRPLLSVLFNALPSWGAKPAPPWEQRVLFWLLVVCLFYGCFLLAIL